MRSRMKFAKCLGRREVAMAIRFNAKPGDRTAASMAHLRRLAAPLPLGMKPVLERDATLKLVLLLPGDVLSEALAVGKALRACAEHRRRIPEDRAGGRRR